MQDSELLQNTRYGKIHMKKEIFRAAFVRSIPILCSYIFVSMAYGIMMQNAGFPWFASLFVSLTVYTGAFQFVLITFLSSGAVSYTHLLPPFLFQMPGQQADGPAGQKVQQKDRKINTKRCIRAVHAVSYTHLDVYKRQSRRRYAHIHMRPESS